MRARLRAGAGGIREAAKRRRDEEAHGGAVEKPRVKKKKLAEVDPLIEAEDMEIRRLEKLLGIGKKVNKKSSAAKLNKEYAEFEGIEGDFGDFLLGLDDLVESVTAGQGDGAAVELSAGPSSNEKEGDASANEAESTPSDNDAESARDSHDEATVEGSDDTDEDDEEDEEAAAAAAAEAVTNEEQEKHTYRPVQGEDIYGRVMDPAAAAAATAKYIPPSRRFAQAGEGAALLKHRITGLMNKLAETTRDYIIKELSTLFRENSTYECMELLFQNIHGASLVRHSVMTGFIPLQMVIVVAMHIVVGSDVGATMVERTIAKLMEEVAQGAEEGNKLPHNCLLMVVCLYNFKILHHTLVMDLLLALVQPRQRAEQEASVQMKALLGLDLMYRTELVELVLFHAGATLRNDDPANMMLITQQLKDTMAGVGAATDGSSNTRLVYMLELLTDLKQGKVRKVMVQLGDAVKSQRKFLGNVKTTYNKTSSLVVPMRVTLRDILEADKRGRWWRTGASFNNLADKDAAAAAVAVPATAEVPKERDEADRVVSKLSSKLKLNTGTRKLILKQLLLARDIHDAFERILNLNISGKEDREIVRVLLECCGKEATYNSFYTELLKMLVEGNRQYKMSLQYALWDIFKLVADDEANAHMQEKYVMNLAQLVAHLVMAFTLSLSIIKPIDVSELNKKSILLLSTFFLTIFKDDMDAESFRSLFDRLSTAKDFQDVHGNITYFLETMMKDLPEDLFAPEVRKKVKQKKSLALKILRQMKAAMMI